MDILSTTEHIRKRTIAYGNLTLLHQQSGVTYSWLTKFAAGRITNPTIGNIHKLELFFKKMDIAA